MTLNVTRAIYWNALLCDSRVAFFSLTRKTWKIPPNRMKANFTPESTPSAGSPKRKAGFFESMLIGQLQKIKTGSLIMQHAGKEHLFGSSDDQSAIDIEVINPAFSAKPV